MLVQLISNALCYASTFAMGLCLVREDRPDQIHVVDLSAAGIDRLKQLIDLIIAHLLAQVCEDIAQLTDADEASHVLVEDLKATAVFFRLARISEAAWSVEDFAEGVEVDCASR